MSAYNRTKVVEFIKEHAPVLSTMEKFRGLSTDTSNDAVVQSYIDRMKLTPNDMSILMRIFRMIKIPPGNMFVHTESFCDKGEIKPGMQVTTDKFFEMTPSVYKGFMCYTSCWLPNETWTIRNNGKKFNISTNSAFMGKYHECFGRILIYRNTEELNMLFTGIQNLGGRKAFTYLITKLLLGNDYNFDFKGFSGMVRLPEMCKKNCHPNCTTGLWSYEKSLIEQCWGYFMELAFYEKTGGIPISGMIINDSSHDDVDNEELSGTEYRVFCIDKTMTLESVLYRDKFYMNRVHYQKRIEKDIMSYDPSRLTSVKRDDTALNIINSLLDTYCASRQFYGINANIFDREPDPSKQYDKTFKVAPTPSLVVDNDNIQSNMSVSTLPVVKTLHPNLIQRQKIQNLKQEQLIPMDGGDLYRNKYIKYKNKYLQLKNK